MAGVGLAFYLFALPLMNPLRGSPEQVTAWLMEQTPPGIARAEVEALVSQRGWLPGGILGQEPPGGIGVELGHYEDLGFRTSVFAYWVFDTEDRLQSVRVNKAVLNAP